MFNSASLSKIKFLFDENVDKRLEKFLKEKDKIDIIYKSKGLSNGKLVEFSKSEQRIFVTNDRDFIKLKKSDIFSVLLLKIPQRKIDLLIKSFSKLLRDMNKEEDRKSTRLNSSHMSI